MTGFGYFVMDRFGMIRSHYVLMVAALVCFANLFGHCLAQLPPSPRLPEVGDEVRNELFSNLESEYYFARDSAQKLLKQGGLQTVSAIAVFIKQASLEGKIRAFQIALHINLELLRKQMDEQALKASELLDEMRLIDDETFGHRLDAFRAIHYSLFERSAARTLTKLNAVIEYEPGSRTYPGLNDHNLSTEIPRQIFIGDNWLGSKDDLRHIAVILKYGQNNFGARVIYRIKGCPIELSDLQDLAAGLPGVAVSERSRARLGVGTSAGGPGTVQWKITSMQSGSPAALAGIRLGDTVVRNQNKIMNSFDDLVKSLNQNEPGDQIELDILSNRVLPEIVELTIPQLPDDLGITIDEKFLRFAIIKSIKKDSAADKAGLSQMYVIDRLDRQPVFNAADFQLRMSGFSPGDKIEIQVRPLKIVTVRLRGWVGPYR